MKSAPAYRQLDVWQLSMTFVEDCYKATAGFPREELYGLTSQIRRAAVSIPSNVAEGHCRRKTKVYAHHVSIALGSHGELETCIELAHRLNFISADVLRTLERKAEAVGRLLSGLYRSLKAKLARDARSNGPKLCTVTPEHPRVVARSQSRAPGRSP